MAIATEMILPRLFEDAAKPLLFLRENYARLLNDYPERFVAVKGGEVVASELDLGRLWLTLQGMGLNVRTEVSLHFISAGSASMLL